MRRELQRYLFCYAEKQSLAAEGSRFVAGDDFARLGLAVVKQNEIFKQIHKAGLAADPHHQDLGAGGEAFDQSVQSAVLRYWAYGPEPGRHRADDTVVLPSAVADPWL